MANILITGASGFVGSFLVEEALRRGLNVFAGIRKTSSRQYLQDDRIGFVELDFSDPDQIRRALENQAFDYIIHNAGVTKANDPQTYMTVNAEYTERFARLAQVHQEDLKKFTFISSIAAYGPADQTEDGLIADGSKPQPITQYGRSKLKAESLLKAIDRLPWFIIRPTAVFGPRERDIYTVFKTVKRGLAPVIGSRDQALTFIYVKDLARLVIDATLSEKYHQAVFASDGKTYSAADLNRAIAGAMQRKTLAFVIPVGIVRAMAWINETVGKWVGKYPAFNLEKVHELASTSWKCDISPIQKDLNFAPAYTLEDAVRETTAWYVANQWL